MGMLGALAGFGQGLQDYSKVLQKKQEQDWLDQRARVKYEREQNLANLTHQRQRENIEYSDKLAGQRQETQNKFLLEQRQIDKEAEAAKLAEARQYAAGPGLELYKEQQKIATDENIRQSNAAQANAIATQRALYNFKQATSKSESEQMLKDMEGSEFWKMLSPQEQALMQFGAKNPKAAASISAVLKRGDTVKFTGEDIVKLTAQATEEFKDLSTNKDRKEEYQIWLSKTSKAANNGEPLSTTQAQFLFTNQFIDNVKPGKGVATKSNPQTSATSDEITITQDNLNFLAQKSPEAREQYIKNIVEPKSPETAQRLRRQFATGGSGLSVGTSLEPVPQKESGNALTRFATRNAPGGYNTTRAEVEKANPQSKYETDLAYKIRIDGMMK